jgi:chromosome segregation ATPase
LLRHYPIRGQRHGEKKVLQERKPRFIKQETELGWHRQYNEIRDDSYQFVRNPDTLQVFDIDKIRLELALPAAMVENVMGELNRTLEELQNLKSRAGNLEIERNELKKHAANLEAERDSYRRVIDEIEPDRIAVRKKADALQERVNALELEVTEHRTTLASIQNSFAWRLLSKMFKLR